MWLGSCGLLCSLLKIQRSTFLYEGVEFFLLFVGEFVGPRASLVAKSFDKEFHTDDSSILCLRAMGCVFPEEF
jgi:hypothetical protein